MLLMEKSLDVLTHGHLDSTAFKVEMNAMLFHSVIDGIYADKIRAPFRELATNARDAHALAGNLDEPFDIFLPSVLNPYFKVRDYGCSMTHDEIMGLYSTMFASSKRATNDAVGMIGLGSKSPFAYTSIFTVSAVMNGRKRMYSAFIGDEGVPQISLISDEESNERQGLEVSFPVKMEDIDKFRLAANDVLFGFDPFPNVLNEQFERTPPTVLYEGEGWVFYQKGTTPFDRLMARQGCVLYPIDPRAVDSNSALLNCPVVIDFPIGDLSVSTSREALGYDQKTVANIKAQIERVTAELGKQVSDTISDAPSYLDACNLLTQGLLWTSPTSWIYQAVRNHLFWRGREVVTEFRLSGQQQDFTIARFSRSSDDVTRQVSHRPVSAYGTTWSAQTILSHKVVAEFSDCTYGPSRVRRVMSETDKPIIWIRAADAKALEAALAQIGTPEFENLEKFEPLFLNRSRQKGAKSEKVTLRFLQSGFQAPGKNAQFETLEPTDGLVYVLQNGSYFQMGTRQTLSARYIVEDVLYTAANAKAIDASTKVYCISTSRRKLLEKHKWISLEEFLKKKIRENVDFGIFAAGYSGYNLRSVLQKALEISNLSISVPKDIQDWVDLALANADSIKAEVSHPTYGFRTLVGLLMSDELAAAQAKGNPVLAGYEALKSTYPLLDTATSHPSHLKHYLELLTR